MIISNPKISILITNYNNEKFIKKTLKSCFDQSYRNKEIIVFDDKSTDKSLNILQNYTNKIILIKNNSKKNSAPLNQINGIIKSYKKSKGMYLFLLDGDDMYHKDKVKKILGKLEKKKKIEYLQDRPIKMSNGLKMKKKDKLHLFSIWPSFYPTSSIVVRRNFFKKFLKVINKNKFPNLEIDARISIYAFLTNNFNSINESYTYYNDHMLGITSKYNKYSCMWWQKRKEAFEYMYYLMSSLNIKFKRGPDFYITKLINQFIN